MAQKMIEFEWTGVKYTAPFLLPKGNVVILPDNTVLEITAWSRTEPYIANYVRLSKIHLKLAKQMIKEGSAIKAKMV